MRTLASDAMIKAIETYQVPGSVGEFSEESSIDHGWVGHCPGTMVSGIGTIFLGMPKGFNRLGPITSPVHVPLRIFESWDDFKTAWRGGYSMFNIPCWKYLDEHGNTLVRGLMPRINTPFLHVFLGDVRQNIECLEITNHDMEGMD